VIHSLLIYPPTSDVPSLSDEKTSDMTAACAAYFAGVTACGKTSREVPIQVIDGTQSPTQRFVHARRFAVPISELQIIELAT